MGTSHVSKIRMPRFFTIFLAGGEQYTMRALGPEDARALFHDCGIVGAAFARVVEAVVPHRSIDDRAAAE
jgi:hypothetical protein